MIKLRRKSNLQDLNEREKSILAFIEMQVKKEGYPPSVREIGKAVGLNSTATVHGYIKRLSDKGYISKVDQKGRTLKVVKGEKYKNQEQISQMQSTNNNQDVYTAKEMVNVPVIGKITAGEPILAVENITDTFPIPVDFVGNSESFMLKVRGESMIEAGILDGEIVVALIGEEATVKTFYKEKDHIRLQPENSALEPIIVPMCEILGKVAGVFRKL